MSEQIDDEITKTEFKAKRKRLGSHPVEEKSAE
jgi:hypothetical protein